MNSLTSSSITKLDNHLNSFEDFNSISSKNSNPQSPIPFQRGREMYFHRNRFMNEINTSKNSTCATKNFIPPKLMPNYRIKVNKPKRKSSSYSNSPYSESDSLSSSEYKKNNLIEKDKSFIYPTKKEVGIYSSDDESFGLDLSLRDNLENEIERVLIEIYNKNISNCKYNTNVKNFCSCDKLIITNKRKSKGSKSELKQTFKQLNREYNYIVLQTLSKKIKELINKYKEKIFEIPEIAKINEQYKSKKADLTLKTNLSLKGKNDISKHFAVTSLFNSTVVFKQQEMINSSFLLNTPPQSPMDKKNTLLISPQNKIYNLSLQNEIKEHGIKDIIIRELINIKHTLKRSSYEIYQIFQYPLSFLKRKFSIKKMHLEAFNSILLNDELIYTLLLQIKLIYEKIQSKKILELLSVIEEESSYSCKEMTQFDEMVSKNEPAEHDFFENTQSFEKENNNTTAEDNKVSCDIDIDIDELIKYIDSNDDEFGSNGTAHKKKKKKKKNKKNVANCNSIDNENNIPQSIENNENNEEVSNFKKELINSTLESYNCQKLKIEIDAKWLISLRK